MKDSEFEWFMKACNWTYFNLEYIDYSDEITQAVIARLKGWDK